MTEPAITIAGTCPLCQRSLTLRQARDGRHFYVACVDRHCEFRSAYDPVLTQLHNRIARLEAELTFAHLQSRPLQETSALVQRRCLTTWADMAHRFARASEAETREGA